MPAPERLETTFYSHKRAHKSWMDNAILKGITPSDETSELVWELLVEYNDSIGNFESHKEDIFETAEELAQIVLKEINIDQANEIYRNCMLDSIMDSSISLTNQQLKDLVRFTEVVSDAFSKTNAESLKKTIRHSRSDNLSNELKVAKQIQLHLLPKAIPKIEGYEFAGRLVPAAEVGGDYWSIKNNADDGIVTLKLADISGHGIAAATLVAAVKFISGGYYRGSKSASEVMRQTNRVLTKETPYDMLVTMVYAWLYPATGEISIINAGHAPVYICRKGVCIDIIPTGPVLGVTENVNYREEKLKLYKNDILFFGSDGIIEAGIGEQFGTKRLKQLISNNAEQPADVLADTIIKAVKDYTKQPHDDISLLIVKVTGKKVSLE